jgi:adenosylcobinamide kinase/adenosylcobinamide-phosphate guanylyltransferase
VLVLGGARSGKSLYAEQLLARERGGVYLACGTVPDGSDPEWDERIATHRARRPDTWQTVETLDVASTLVSRGPAVLIDCVTTWLAGTMDDLEIWSDDTPGAPTRLADAVDEFVDAWSKAERRVIAVSNEIGSGVVPATPSGRRFRDELGVLNTRLAAASDQVWLVTAGIKQRLK